MFLRIHRGRDQGQKMCAVTGRPQAAPVGFMNHPRVDSPPAKRSSLDVLRTKGDSQIHGALDVISISFGLDSASLLLIDGPVAVELKAAVADARTGKCAACYRVCISDQ